MNFSSSYLDFQYYNYTNLPLDAKLLKILVVFNEEEDKTANFEFMQKVFGAAKKDIYTEISLIKLKPNTTFPLASMDSFEDVSFIFSFGVPPNELGLAIAGALDEITIIGSKKFIFSKPLAALIDDKTAKGILWNQLKTLFL